MKISIIGGGSWGSTLAQALTDNGNTVLIRDVNPLFIKNINENHQHPFFQVTIPESIKATLSLEEAVDYSDFIILCVPTKFTRNVLKEINGLITSPKLFVNVSKGIEPNTSCLVSQIVKQEISEKNLKGYVVLSGPSHAEELILRKLTAFVSASTNPEYAKFVQEIFSNENYMRVYTSEDVVGVETGGAIKNAIAIVSGVASGLGLGENCRAALISRGVREIVAIVEALGGNKETAYGLSGIGDLIVTASSQNSRNFQAGYRMGQGVPVAEVLAEAKQTVEGVRTIEAAYEIGEKYGLDLPIMSVAYAFIKGKLSLDELIPAVMNRKLKSEM